MSQMMYACIEYDICPECATYSFFARVAIERNFTLFALLDGRPTEQIAPCVALRGMPTNANINTTRNFYLHIVDYETDGEHRISREKAEQWIAEGSAQWFGLYHITDPGCFSPSWLDTAELEHVYHQYLLRDSTKLLTLEATLGAMHLLPQARLVYWFGN